MRFVHAADYAEGLSASLKAGIAAVPEDCAAALVCLGDMPLVTGRMIDRLLSHYDPDEGRLIVLPTFRGKQGNPMLWDRRFFPEILQITGDSGARFLLGKHMEAVAEVEMADDAVLRDFDTTESLATLPQRLRARADRLRPMPICEADPWRFQYFEHVACPDDVRISDRGSGFLGMVPATSLDLRQTRGGPVAGAAGGAARRDAAGVPGVLQADHEPARHGHPAARSSPLPRNTGRR